MPYKFETLKTPMPRTKDKRVKLTDQERTEIKELESVFGALKTAKMYGVSKRTIQFIRDPAKQAANMLRRSERGGSAIYYDTDKNTESMRVHRQYKAAVLKEN